MRTIENNIINANIKLQDENKLLKGDIDLLQAKLDVIKETVEQMAESPRYKEMMYEIEMLLKMVGGDVQ